jgi:hypothetical protein
MRNNFDLEINYLILFCLDHDILNQHLGLYGIPQVGLGLLAGLDAMQKVLDLSHESPSVQIGIPGAVVWFLPGLDGFILDELQVRKDIQLQGGAITV